MKYHSFYSFTLTGILLALSWPVYGFSLLIFFAWVPMLLAEQRYIIYKEKHSGWKVFFFTWWAFLIWNFKGAYWLHYAQRPDGSYAWEAFLAPIIANSFLMALVFSSYHWVKRKVGSYLGLLYLPLAWLSFEKLHLEWELAWPWFNLGNVFANDVQWVQWYDITGVFGGSLWIWSTNLIIFYFYRSYQASRKRLYLKKMMLWLSVVIVLPMGVSYLKYISFDSTKKKAKGIETVIIQPDLDPYTEKYELSEDSIRNRYLGLAKEKISPSTQLIVLPETALPGRAAWDLELYPKEDGYLQLVNWLKANAPQAYLLTGVEFQKIYTSKPANPRAFSLPTWGNSFWMERYNSAILISSNGSSQFYHKSKLVPGVEIFPYASLLEGIVGNTLMDFGGSTHSITGQEKPSILQTKENLKIAPIICYEAVFGEYVSEFVHQGANIIAVISNDSWWGDSEGPEQLLALSRLRAIENRRWIARSANSGISAFINERGDVVAKMEYLYRGGMKGLVYANNSQTTYSMYGDVIARIALLLWGLVCAYIISQIVLKKSK